MLVFVDESGDTGFKFDKGSQPLFAVTLVILSDHGIAREIDDRISELRSEIGVASSFEFHFTRVSDAFRSAFFSAVAPFTFEYISLVIDKTALTPDFTNKTIFYNWVCGMVFEDAKPHLLDAVVKVDHSGNRDFQRELRRYLKQRMNGPSSNRKHIRDIESVRSSGNNLVQLADMACGAVTRSFKPRPDSDRFRKIIAHRQRSVRYWPEL